MRHLYIFAISILLLLLSCSKDKSTTPNNNVPTVTPVPTNGGGNGGGNNEPIKFSYLRDGVLFEHTDENSVNHNEPTNKYVNAFSDKTYRDANYVITKNERIEITIYRIQMDEIVLNQEYYFDTDGSSLPIFAGISYFISDYSGSSSSFYNTDIDSEGFVKITNINLTDSTFSGIYEGVLWEDPSYGNGYMVIQNGSFTNVRFRNLN